MSLAWSAWVQCSSSPGRYTSVTSRGGTPRPGPGDGMSNNGNGPQRNSGRAGDRPGAAGAQGTPRAPRRLVLLADGEHSEVTQVLAEYEGADVSGKRLHADLQRLADEHRGRCVAGEWRGRLGWTRFLWCRR